MFKSMNNDLHFFEVTPTTLGSDAADFIFLIVIFLGLRLGFLPSTNLVFISQCAKMILNSNKFLYKFLYVV